MKTPPRDAPHDGTTGYDTLTVSEIFGPTVQGEGRHAGQRCAFLRLMGCNLHCSWCDTAYTWDARRFDLRTEGHRVWSMQLADYIMCMEVRRLVISGGEPLLHQEQFGWNVLLSTMNGAGIKVDVETNGTIEPNAVTARGVDLFTVSPKLAHAGDPESRRIKPKAINALRLLGSDFKFVCATPAHVIEVEQLVQRLHLPKDHVWIMPLGTERNEIDHHLSKISDTAIAAGFNITGRLHISTWGNEREH